MPFSEAAMQNAALGLQANCSYAQSHYGDPGTGSSNVNTGPRKAVSWSTPTGLGNFNLADDIDFTGIAPSNAVAWISFWSASSGGTFGGKFELAGDDNANASGQYTVSSIPLTGAST